MTNKVLGSLLYNLMVDNHFISGFYESGTTNSVGFRIRTDHIKRLNRAIAYLQSRQGR